VVEEGGAVRFESCTVETDSATTTLDGRVDVTDGRVTADVDIVVTATLDGQEFTTHTSVTADLSVTATRVEGRVDSTTSASLPGGGSAHQSAAAIYDIELADGCAVGGDLRLGIEQSASAGGQSRSVRAIGRAVFGPECGDVQVFARTD
jgi:hypothetical protein